MLDHMILTVSDVERSLAFYEAALKPLNIKFFLPYKGEGEHPDLWDLVMARGRASGSRKGSLIQHLFTGVSLPKTRVK
jgi:catechol 2,3-dioxygenase-like lactoylglutathione lyase family enzyme